MPVVEPLLAGCSILALVDLRDAEGTGSVLLIGVATPILVPAPGIVQFENVVLTGDEVECTHAQDFVSSSKLDHHSADRCIETLRRIAQAVADCADCLVD